MNRLRVQHHSLFLQERHQHGVEAAFLINEDIDVFCIADDLADFPRGLMDFWKAVLIHPDGITDKLNVDEVPEEQEKQRRVFVLKIDNQSTIHHLEDT